jgi:glycine/D-amino acid oxidase-like deaminating enzyme
MHLVERACRRGVVRYRDRVMRLEAGGVSLHDGSRLHGLVLVATGCALGELLPTLPLRLRKGHLVITDRYPGRIRHQLLQLGYADSAHGEADSSVAFNVQPRPSGQLLIGSSRENCSTTREVSMPMVQRMLQRAFEFLPGLRPLQALRIWTGLRPVSVDGLPYLGRVPDRPGVWVAAGHEGLGITTSLGSARLLVDQLLGREPAIDPRPYDPARVAA